jgi:uncharacterized protein with PIN domain
MALCPSCDKPIAHLNLKEVKASVFLGTQWRGITYSCPHCQHVLSAGIDPIAIRSDIVQQVVAALRKR